jgi:hypothetical protein
VQFRVASYKSLIHKPFYDMVIYQDLNNLKIKKKGVVTLSVTIRTLSVVVTLSVTIRTLSVRV